MKKHIKLKCSCQDKCSVLYALNFKDGDIEIGVQDKYIDKILSKSKEKSGPAVIINSTQAKELIKFINQCLKTSKKKK